MKTVPNAVEKIIQKTPFLEEALSEGLINLSALARKLKSEIEEEVLKKVKEGSIMMALKRLPKQIKTESKVRQIFRKRNELIIRSNLFVVTVLNTDFPFEKHKEIVSYLSNQQYFLTITQGIFETTIIASNELKEKVEKIVNKQRIISSLDELSSITIRLPGKIVLTPGVYYSILKYLAWKGINIVEVVSTFSEFTIILQDKYVDKAFSVLKRNLG